MSAAEFWRGYHPHLGDRCGPPLNPSLFGKGQGEGFPNLVRHFSEPGMPVSLLQRAGI